MAFEHYRNISCKGSRTGVPAKIVEIELLTWSDTYLWRGSLLPLGCEAALKYSASDTLSHNTTTAAQPSESKRSRQIMSPHPKKDVWW
jgi:hypothetical protein